MASQDLAYILSGWCHVQEDTSGGSWTSPSHRLGESLLLPEWLSLVGSEFLTSRVFLQETQTATLAPGTKGQQ
jgi:hypothetical protein